MSNPKHIVAVAGAFFNDQGQLLLVKTERRGWECPGGQVEEGEDLVSALVREVWEETGCEVEVERQVGVYTNLTAPSKVMFVFIGRHVGGVLGTSDEQDAGWFTVEEAMVAIVHPANRLKLRDALNPREQPVYRVYATSPFALIDQRTW